VKSGFYAMNGPMNTYYDLVYAVVRKVPRGRVTTYGIIADFLALGASRMVGWALNQCQPGDGVPAHRVVNRKGELSGRHHFSPPERMQQLLEAEGVEVKDDCILRFRELLWRPDESLYEELDIQP
jgi:methylated-DNA-protein-cysteine methyltransferase related protein